MNWADLLELVSNSFSQIDNFPNGALRAISLFLRLYI